MIILNWIANKWDRRIWTEYRLQRMSVYNRDEQILGAMPVNIRGFFARNLFCFTLLTPRILVCLLHFLNICAHMVHIIKNIIPM
jgi:hypothetical protein